MKRIPLYLLLCTSLLVLLTTACSTASSTTQAGMPTSLPVSQPEAGNRPPVVLRVVEREELQNNKEVYYKDIYFADPDGDAVALTSKVISSSLSYPITLTDDIVQASAEQQKGEALVTTWVGCGVKADLVVESRILDKAGNLSEPLTFTYTCRVLPIDIRPYIMTGLTTALPIAVVLLVLYWLLFRRHPEQRLPALRSFLLLTCLLFLAGFIQMALHEGGHSLYLLALGIPITVYAHPFSFSGFARPFLYNSIWTHILGSSVALPVALLITLPLWKRRSLALLPLVILFPYVALGDGMNIMPIEGDFLNLVHTTGLPAFIFFVLGASIILVGMISIFALLPLLGLTPEDKKCLFVFPAAMFLRSAISMVVAYLVVPGSPIDQEFFLGREIIVAANSILMQTCIGLLLALIYTTLYRKVYKKLPAWLRTEKVELTWKDLRLPGLLWAISVILGLVIIA